MQLSLIKSFVSIEKDWERLYDCTENVSPFLSPSAWRIAYKYYYPYYIAHRYRPIFAVFSENGIIRAIVPLTKSTRGVYKLFGDTNGFNECGMLFDSPGILPECIQLLSERLKIVEFLKIDERSPLACFVSPCNRISVSNNVAISFGNSYDEYFKSLSSSVRQNVRTAYNRLVKDGHTYDVKLYGGDDSLPLDDILWLYFKRHKERYGVDTSALKRWFIKHQSFATRFYRFADNAITVFLTIDGVPAAFLSGLYKDNRIIVPRLSINNDFKRYSPGMILVCETIKSLITATPIRVLDLSLGEEPYKYQLGGILHYTYRFKL